MIAFQFADQALDSLSNIYLGLDDDIEDDYLSSSGPDVLQAIPGQSLPAQGEAPNFFTDPDVYLGPDEDLIESDVYLGPEEDLIGSDVVAQCADTPRNALAMPEVHPSSNVTSPGHHLAMPELTDVDVDSMVQDASVTSNVPSPGHHLVNPELTTEELYAMVWEFQPLGTYDYPELQSFQN
ncbi:hypothetical protein BDR04DRAFT_1233457 [Suillus decipiens]|nr:hypothetical protein BDR04DRAFT_1233457 [Suillus decipiens]